MALPVVMKSGKNYLTLVLDPELSFPDLLQEIVAKFLESEKFFGDEPIAVMLEGRELSGTEQLQIMDAIDCYTSVHVAVLVENDRIREYAADEALRRNLFPEEFAVDSISDEAVCTFIPRSVKAGEQISSDNTIVVSGDVEKGATVSSGEHIIVFGALCGQALCGLSGDENCYIAALAFDPENLRIGETLWTKGRNKKSFFSGLNKRGRQDTPKVAILKDGVIQINEVTQHI